MRNREQTTVFGFNRSRGRSNRGLSSICYGLFCLSRRRSKNKFVLFVNVFFMMFFLVLSFSGGAMESNKSEEICFIVDQRRVCISEEFRPGKFIEGGDLSRVKLIINSSSVFKGGVAYIGRYGDSRDDPGRMLYNYASGHNKLQNLDSTEDYELFKSLLAGRDKDYLFFAKRTEEYIVYSCVFKNICSVRGSYEGELNIRIDFNVNDSSREDLASLFEAYVGIKSRIFKE